MNTRGWWTAAGRVVWRILTSSRPVFYTARHAGEPPLTVPEHPLRCKHCPTPIRFSGHPAGGFVGPGGTSHCPDTSIRHEPMPSVLG